MGISRILAMVLAAAVLLAALHVVLAHDLTAADSRIAASADGENEGPPADPANDHDADQCFFCQVLAHAAPSEPGASAAIVLRATLTSAPFPLPRPAIPGLRLRPPRFS